MKKSGFTSRIKVLVRKIQQALYKKLHAICHRAEHLFHSAYMGAVAYEAHGYYRYAAMGCFALIVVIACMGGGADAETVAEELEEL